MRVQINRIDGHLIVRGEYASVKDCLERNRRVSMFGADLSGADLSCAILFGTDFRDADFSRAVLRGADLRGANFSNATFWGADLSGANLAEACFVNADLWKANLWAARFLCPPMVLLAGWGEVSDDLCVDLMRYDASNHPDPKKFLDWGLGGPCPYCDENIIRSANFIERRHLITSGFLKLRVRSAYELMQVLIKEKCISKP
jgi:hypothetical protein